jgi:hypothetical protein
MGHIPYTEEYFAALGAIIARKIFAVTTKQFKVIVSDCDDTLWRGTCGEVGAKVSILRRSGYRVFWWRKSMKAWCSVCAARMNVAVWKMFLSTKAT